MGHKLINWGECIHVTIPCMDGLGFYMEVSLPLRHISFPQLSTWGGELQL